MSGYEYDVGLFYSQEDAETVPFNNFRDAITTSGLLCASFWEDIQGGPGYKLEGADKLCNRCAFVVVYFSKKFACAHYMKLTNPGDRGFYHMSMEILTHIVCKIGNRRLVPVYETKETEEKYPHKSMTSLTSFYVQEPEGFSGLIKQLLKSCKAGLEVPVSGHNVVATKEDNCKDNCKSAEDRKAEADNDIIGAKKNNPGQVPSGGLAGSFDTDTLPIQMTDISLNEKDAAEESCIKLYTVFIKTKLLMIVKKHMIKKVNEKCKSVRRDKKREMYMADPVQYAFNELNLNLSKKQKEEILTFDDFDLYLALVAIAQLEEASVKDLATCVKQCRNDLSHVLEGCQGWSETKLKGCLANICSLVEAVCTEKDLLSYKEEVCGLTSGTEGFNTKDNLEDIKKALKAEKDRAGEELSEEQRKGIDRFLAMLDRRLLQIGADTSVLKVHKFYPEDIRSVLPDQLKPFSKLIADNLEPRIFLKNVHLFPEYLDTNDEEMVLDKGPRIKQVHMFVMRLFNCERTSEEYPLKRVVAFTQALSDSPQAFLYELIQRAVMGERQSQLVIRQMEKDISQMEKDIREGRTQLNGSRSFLVENISDPSEYYDHLLQNKVLCKEDEDTLKGLSKEDFLDLLQRRGPKAYKVFLEALKKAKQGHIVIELTKAGSEADA